MRLFPTLFPGGIFLLCWLWGCAPRSAPETPGPPPDRQDVTVEDVYFAHGNDRLAGSLFLPTAPGPHPAVALVSGSEAHDRVYGGVGPALGRWFAGRGFVCLTWDKPGVGKSTGDYTAQSFHDRAGEALAAVRFLLGRADVRGDRVGLWGHSQGGMVVPLAASLSAEVAFVIEVAGWQGPAWEQDPVRVEAELRAAHFPEADVAEAVAFARRRMDLIRGGRPFGELDRAQETVMNRSWFVAVHRCDRVRFESARRVVGHDSGPSWEGVRCPVLVIYGDKDTSSGPPDGLVTVIRRGLAKAGNRDVTVKIFRDADHSLRRPREGGRKGEDDPEFVPGYLDTMTAWLTERFGHGR